MGGTRSAHIVAEVFPLFDGSSFDGPVAATAFRPIATPQPYQKPKSNGQTQTRQK